jgi:protocatechuate 3,4-dioxygenase beta subunit
MMNQKLCSCLAVVAFLSLAASAAAAQATSSTLTTVTPSEPGTKLTVHGTVVDEQGRPVAEAQLHITQTDASGYYTPERAMDEPNARLSGWIRSDAQGHFELHTIRPGSYPQSTRLGERDRRIPAHIHIDVDAPGYAQRKLQAVFADDPVLEEPYWQNWAASHQHPVLEVKTAEGGEEATLRISLKSSGHE